MRRMRGSITCYRSAHFALQRRLVEACKFTSRKTVPGGTRNVKALSVAGSKLPRWGVDVPLMRFLRPGVAIAS
jgi:hypothetical protein